MVTLNPTKSLEICLEILQSQEAVFLNPDITIVLQIKGKKEIS